MNGAPGGNQAIDREVARRQRIKEMSFKELSDFAAGEILQGLMTGKFQSSVHRMLNMAAQWQQERSND